MSLAAKLISAAIAAGATLALGAYAKKKSEEKLAPAPIENDEISGETDAKILLSGSPSDGFLWQYKMSEDGIVKEISNNFVRLNTVEKAEGFYNYEFYPLKDGVTELEFDYVRAWDKSEAKQVITYTVTVKGKKIVRCDAAGDLDMIYKAK